MVLLGQEGGEEECLLGMERSVNCAPWEREPWSKLEVVRKAVEGRLPGPEEPEEVDK